MISGKEDEVVPESHMLRLWELAGSRGAKMDAKKNKRKFKQEGEGSENVAHGNNDTFKSIPGGTHGVSCSSSYIFVLVNKF